MREFYVAVLMLLVVVATLVVSDHIGTELQSDTRGLLQTIGAGAMGILGWAGGRLHVKAQNKRPK